MSFGVGTYGVGVYGGGLAVELPPLTEVIPVDIAIAVRDITATTDLRDLTVQVRHVDVISRKVPEP